MGEVVIRIDDSATFISDMQKPLYIVKLLNSPPFHTILLIVVAATSILSIFLGMLLKWFLFLLIICSTQLIVSILSYFVEQFLIIKKKKALFFVFDLKPSLDFFFWCTSLLLAWLLLTKSNVVVYFVTTTLATCVTGTGMFTLKIVILKVLHCRFQDTNFFDNLQGMIFQEHVLQSLLGGGALSKHRIKPPLKSIKTLFFKMQQLMCSTSSFANTYHDVSDHQVDTVVSLVYKNLTDGEPRDLQHRDLLQVMKEEAIVTVLNLFQGATATNCINVACLKDWMVKVCNNRRILFHLLNDTSSIIEELDNIVSKFLLFSVAVLWCVLMILGTTNILVYVSHLLALVFMIWHYCYEGIKLAFMLHPFNIGDRCKIDNERVNLSNLVVKDISLFKTVFLKENGEMMTFSNSVLLTKSIINLDRSPPTTDTLELVVSGTTSFETIAGLKLKIDELIGDKSSLNLKGIEDTRRIYVLEVTRFTNLGDYNYKQRKSQKYELVSELDKLFQELKIKDSSIHWAA